MATTSDRADSNGKTTISNYYKKKNGEDEESNKLKSSSSNGVHGKKITKKVNGSLKLGKTDMLSSIQSFNENKKSDQTSLKPNKSSDINTYKKNDETTQQSEESESTFMSSTSIRNNNHIKKEEANIASSSSNNNEDSQTDKSTSAISDFKTDDNIKNKESTSQFITSNSKKANYAFSVEKDDAQHLTDFQMEKARYFFNVNLDIENKEYVTWEDVEFYLLFHSTAAGKEGSDGGDLEARLSRAASAFWEHIHDQVPLPDGKRDTLTLDQFLDAWAGLIDYVVRTNQLPPIIQDLVKLGFELYSTDNDNDSPATIQPAAFDQLFQKMNINRPYAIMAYKYLTENGTKPLDTDKIDSIVKAVITSSDDEHDSHFLLPGFFKTIASIRNNEKEHKDKSPSPPPDEDLSQISDKSTPTATPPRTPTPPSHSPPTSASSSSSSFQSKLPNNSSTIIKEQQKPSESSSSSSPQLQQQNGYSPPSSPEQKPNNVSPIQNATNSIPQNKVIKSPTSSTSSIQQQNIQPSVQPQKAVIQQEDDNIRNLLRYYHIDDGDLFEVSDGSAQRLVLVHPERPLPPYIQHDRKLLQRLHPDSTNALFAQQNGFTVSPNHPNNNEKSSKEAIETKSNTTSDERTLHDRPQKRSTPPSRQEQTEESSLPTDSRKMYSELNEEQRKKAQFQGTQSVNMKKKRPIEENSTTSNMSSKYDDKKARKDINHEEEEKIVAAVLRQLAPIVEKRVSEELRRIENDETDQDEDDGFIPFPFMLAGGIPFFGGPHGGSSSQASRHQQKNSQQNGVGQEHQTNGHRGADFGGLSGGAAFIPPPLLMAMMSDLTRGPGGDIHGFQSNMPPPPRGAGGVEGFMMFVDDNQMMGGAPGFPQRCGARF